MKQSSGDNPNNSAAFSAERALVLAAFANPTIRATTQVVANKLFKSNRIRFTLDGWLEPWNHERLVTCSIRGRDFIEYAPNSRRFANGQQDD